MERLIFLLPSRLDYDPITIISLSHKKLSLLHIGFLDTVCFLDIVLDLTESNGYLIPFPMFLLIGRALNSLLAL